ncbi:hypothetical protein K7G90_001630 [Pasteurella canis]|uniref:HI1506-related protein n=1 Tax=Pasteurella TaxID=745 RepID=UPI001CC60451|nr:HI1506-related protein [Pasteurella canis]UAY77381.1 hypothetical protein K7G90_001630 [Pasteurella canis]HDR1418556.1 hypothetical protein [Pasteurella multocida]HDR1424837.1 hypothetical protein [Pasteurella multocida]HDR1846271.1 hypothetical protein [Pasteurella multocida]
MSEIQNETLYQVVVFNKTNKNGYRRAGFSLLKGANLLKNVTQAQIEQFKADPRLVFGSQDPMPIESIEEAEQRLLSEILTNNPSPQGVEGYVSSADLTDDEVKTLLAKKCRELNVEFAEDADNDTLITLINATLKVDELENLTVAQLKDKLTELNVEFKASANKAELIALLKETQNGADK